MSLLAKTERGVFARCFPATEVYPILDAWTEATAYFGVTRYAGPRGGNRPVVELTCLYADLDVYRQADLVAVPPAVLADMILRRIDMLGLPAPSFLIDSGRGYYALWLIEPLPGQAVLRWQAAQRCLVGLLAPLGADPACCDAARVLRIPGTVNPRSGRVVTVVRGDARRYAFDALADQIYRAAGRPTRGELAARRMRKEGDGQSKAVRGLPPAARFAAVLRDLERFRLAWGGDIAEGLRNSWLHLVATALTFVTPADEIETEAQRLAALGTPGLPAAEVKATIQAAVRRAEATTGRFEGPASDPRLHYSGARMAEILGIGRDIAEALGLEQIIAPELRRDRRNAARRAKRKATGGQSRGKFLEGRAVSREKPWIALGISRSTWYARGLHGTMDAEPASTGVASASEAPRTGPVPQQGALSAAEGPERSSSDRGNSEGQALPPKPAGDPTSPKNGPTGGLRKRRGRRSRWGVSTKRRLCSSGSRTPSSLRRVRRRTSPLELSFVPGPGTETSSAVYRMIRSTSSSVIASSVRS